MAAHVQPFHAHIRELRHRVMAVAAVFLVGGILGYVIHPTLIGWLKAPLHESLHYISPSGSLQFIMQVCCAVGAILALPVAVYNLVRFIQPAIAKDHAESARRRTLGFVLASYLLAGCGVAFAYMVILPASLHFFSGFATPGVESMITADRYFSFVVNMVAVFAVISQLPLILWFIDGVHPLPPQQLRKYRKWVIVASFGIAVLVPFAYDPMTQLMMAAPLITLYELSIILLALKHRRTRPTSARRTPQAQATTHPKPLQHRPARPQTMRSPRSQLTPRTAPPPMTPCSGVTALLMESMATPVSQPTYMVDRGHRVRLG